MEIKIIFLFITIYLLKTVIINIYNISGITEFNVWIECTCHLSISHYILLWKNKCAALSPCFLASLPLSRRNLQTCSIILINVLFFFFFQINKIFFYRIHLSNLFGSALNCMKWPQCWTMYGSIYLSSKSSCR